MKDTANVRLPPVDAPWISFWTWRDQLYEGGPALCVGWAAEATTRIPAKVRQLKAPPAAAAPSGEPNGLLLLQHQYGGYACAQMRILGVVLPLLANQHRLPDGAQTLRALELMNHGAWSAAIATQLRDIAPVLEHTWLTSGEAFEGKTFAEWEMLSARWFPSLGALEWGSEALLSLGPVELSAFVGWAALSIQKSEVRDHDGRVGALTPLEAAALRSVGNKLGLGEMRLWLVWDNSD